MGELFSTFGTVKAAEVRKDDKGVGRGFGYVVLANEEEGKRAANEMNSKEVKGNKLSVAAAERRATDDAKAKGKGNAQMTPQQMAYMQQMAYAQQQWAYMVQM